MIGVPRKDGNSIGFVLFNTIDVVMNVIEDGRIVCKINTAKGYNFWNGNMTETGICGEYLTGDL